MKISKRIASLSASQTLQMEARAQQLRAEGHDIISLTLGEPDFAAPDLVKKAAVEAVEQDFSHYTPVPGYMSLREAIADHLRRTLGEPYPYPYEAREILVSGGAKHSLSNAVAALIDPGDEVIVPTPSWVSYKEIVKIAEGTYVPVRTEPENEYCITAEQLEAAITERTRLLLLCSPNNPTGMVYSHDRLISLVEVLERHPQIVVLSDEIYSRIIYCGRHESLAQFASLRDRLVLIGGVSKSHAMTGYRIGWMACHDKELIAACNRLQSQQTSCVCSIAQKAAEAAYRADDTCVEQMRLAFEERKQLVVRLAREIPGLRFVEPQGAFYLFIDVTSYFGKRYGEVVINDTESLVGYLLEYAQVAVVSGAAFGDERCIRISYATKNETIIEAMRRIREALSKLQ